MIEDRVEFRCPHCRRVYKLKLDARKLARLNRIAVCGRCRKRFSLTMRVRESQSDSSPADDAAAIERDLAEVMGVAAKRRKHAVTTPQGTPHRSHTPRESTPRPPPSAPSPERLKRMESDRPSPSQPPRSVPLGEESRPLWGAEQDEQPPWDSEPPPQDQPDLSLARRKAPPKMTPPPLPREAREEATADIAGEALPRDTESPTSAAGEHEHTTPHPPTRGAVAPVKSRFEATLPGAGGAEIRQQVEAAIARMRAAGAEANARKEAAMRGVPDTFTETLPRSERPTPPTRPQLKPLPIVEVGDHQPSDDEVDEVSWSEPPAVGQVTASMEALTATPTPKPPSLQKPNGDGKPHRPTDPGIGETSIPPAAVVEGPADRPTPAEMLAAAAEELADDLDEFDSLDIEDEETGDRPTLMLPDETLIPTLEDLEDERRSSLPPSGPGSVPPSATWRRNIEARVILSRDQWISIADPGLHSLEGERPDAAKALGALLTP